MALSAMFVSSCKKEDSKPAPVANFTFTGDNKPAPCEVSFSNSSTNATSYTWEFGDGASSSEQNPKHTYTTGGTFSVNLTTTGEGGTNTTTLTITIQNPVADPVANFTYTGDNNFAPCLVTFTNTSTNSVSYNWDFGDGQTSTSQTPSHVYNIGGIYNITLTAKNSIGIQDIVNKTVTIINIPTKLKINSIKLTAMSFTNQSGSGWDSWDGPDLFFRVTDDNGTNYIETEIYPDVLPSQLPLIFSNTAIFPISIESFDFKFIIELRDDDGIGSDWIGGYYFTVKDYMPTNGDLYPVLINYTSLTSQLAFTLNVEWVQ